MKPNTIDYEDRGNKMKQIMIGRKFLRRAQDVVEKTKKNLKYTPPEIMIFIEKGGKEDMLKDKRDIGAFIPEELWVEPDDILYVIFLNIEMLMNTYMRADEIGIGQNELFDKTEEMLRYTDNNIKYAACYNLNSQEFNVRELRKKYLGNIVKEKYNDYETRHYEVMEIERLHMCKCGGEDYSCKGCGGTGIIKLIKRQSVAI